MTDQTQPGPEPAEDTPAPAPVPALRLEISADGILTAETSGRGPLRVMAHMLRHVADSMDDSADEEGEPPLPAGQCSGHLRSHATAEELAETVEAARADRAARDAAPHN